jgi:hypothetical protein
MLSGRYALLQPVQRQRKRGAEPPLTYIFMALPNEQAQAPFYICLIRTDCTQLVGHVKSLIVTRIQSRLVETHSLMRFNGPGNRRWWNNRDSYIKSKNKNKLHGLSPRANYTDRATVACRRSDCQLLRIKGGTWSAQQILTAVFSVF